MKGKYYTLLLTLLFAGRGLFAQTESRPVQVLPTDGEVVNTFYPQFVWLSVAKPGDGKLMYSIRVSELKEGQSYADAIQQNLPVWEQRDLTSTSIQYGIEGTLLNENSRYVWQIAALVNDKFVLLSDIWMFKYKKDPPVKDTIIKKNYVPEIYPEVTQMLSSNVHFLKDTIRFFYENYSRQDSVAIEISKYSNKSENGDGVVYKGKIPLGRDKNYIKLQQVNTQKWSTIKTDPSAYYVLQFVNARKESWKLKFQLKGKDEREEQRTRELIEKLRKAGK